MFLIVLDDPSLGPRFYFLGFSRRKASGIRFGRKDAAIRFDSLADALYIQAFIAEKIPGSRFTVEYGG